MAEDIDVAALVAQSKRGVRKCWYCQIPKDHPAQEYLTAVLALPVEDMSAKAVRSKLEQHYGLKPSRTAVGEFLRRERQCH